jgi:hypothetical protein
MREFSSVGFGSFATCFYHGIVFGLFFDPEDGGDMFLGKVG